MKTFPCLLAFLSLASLVAPARADDVPAQVQALVAKQSPAIVTVRAVLKLGSKSAEAQGTEARVEMQGAVVDPSGLIMVSSVPFSVPAILAMMGAPPEAAASAPTITPSDFQVIFGDETTEYPAFLAATDTTLGLTFLKIEDLKGRALTAVGFAAVPPPDLGASVFSLSRLGKGYDYAPVYESARVSGVITKPRAALMLDGGISGLGLPVFGPAGETLGVLTSIPSGVPQDAASAGMGMLTSRLLGGRSAAQQSVFLVPGSAVGPVVIQAAARAATLAAQHAPAPAPVKK